MSDAGIDYGMGSTNIDHDTGIRFGVISKHKVGQAWYDSEELQWGEPCCGECGNEASPIEAVPFDLDDCVATEFAGAFRHYDKLAIPEEHQDDIGKDTWKDEGRDYCCLYCARSFDSDDAFGDEPIGSSYVDEEYKCFASDSDIFIEKSPYYTLCNFCSPCAPGAGYLKSANPNGIKAYCLGPDWFGEGECPYPVYRVDNDECIYTPEASDDE